MNYTDIFKQSMKIGYLFYNTYGSSKELMNWDCEWCAEFTKRIIDLYEKSNRVFSLEKIFDQNAIDVIFEIFHDKDKNWDHLWDDYCKGFLAGEIIGYPLPTNMLLVDWAEYYWDEHDRDGNYTYGYYQEVLEDAKKGKFGYERFIPD